MFTILLIQVMVMDQVLERYEHESLIVPQLINPQQHKQLYSPIMSTSTTTSRRNAADFTNRNDRNPPFKKTTTTKKKKLRQVTTDKVNTRTSIPTTQKEAAVTTVVAEKATRTRLISPSSSSWGNCTTSTTQIPIVIMAYKRVNYMRQLIESLRASDFPKQQGIPIIISHDGHVPEMVDYVETIKKDKDLNIIQLFHPYSCYEHVHSFPGNDTNLNIDYGGDTYGNPRSDWATCCKHHFTWMIHTIFHSSISQLQHVDTFFFTEEDYIFSPTFYQSLCTGMAVMDATEHETTTTTTSSYYFGLTALSGLQQTHVPEYSSTGSFHWTVSTFKTGPMTMNRRIYQQLEDHSIEYCVKYDEYNWDWTLYHLMTDHLLPYHVLQPNNYQLVKHIGVIGMHASEHHNNNQKTKSSGL